MPDLLPDFTPLGQVRVLYLNQGDAVIMGKPIKLHFQGFFAIKKIKLNYVEPLVNSGEKSPYSEAALALLCPWG